MKKDKKQENLQPDEELEMEVDLDALDEVSGGTLRNVRFTKTTDLSDDTIGKIAGS